MRPLGVLLLVISFIVGAALWFWPVQVSFVGTDLDCGAPIVRLMAHDEASNPASQALVDECHSKARGRVIAGVVLGTVIGIAGIILAALGGGREPVTPTVAGPGWYADPSDPAAVRWWDGRQWTAKGVVGQSPPGAPGNGWFPDPSTRYQLRWWDGQQWTAHVSSENGPTLDPEWRPEPSAPPAQ
jgi:hypothetical protein